MIIKYYIIIAIQLKFQNLGLKYKILKSKQKDSLLELNDKMLKIF